MGEAVLVIIFVLLGVCCGYLKVDQIDVAANEKYNKVTVTLDNSDPEKTSISYLSLLTVDKPLQRAKLQISLKNSVETPSTEKLFRCGNEIYKMNIDVCRMGEIQSTTFAKVFMENFAKSSNFDMRCPLAPHNYSLENFSVTDRLLFRFPKEQKLCLDLMLSVSLSTKGKLDIMWQMKAWVRFKKET